MPRILIADDSPDVRRLVRITLGAQRWDVLEADSPDAAVAVAQRERPDVVVLDVVFDGHIADGFTVCRRLRSLPETARIPVLMLTAETSAEMRALADAAGATAYLAKPFTPVELVDTLRSLLDVPEARDGETTAERAGVAPLIRVMIADDHLAVRDGLRALLTRDDGFEVVGVAPDGEEAIALIRARRPDVAILDQEMPRRTGLDVLAEVRRANIPTAIVIFTFDATLRDRAIAAGAAAFLPKDVPPKELSAAVRRAAATHGTPPRASPLAASRAAWGVVARQRRAALVMGVLAVLYAAGFLIAEPVLGAGASLLAIGAVAIAGALLGPEGGALWAVLSSVLTLLLWGVTGHERGEPVITIGGNGIGVIALVGLGAGFGVMRQVRSRFAGHGRHVEALLESGLFIGAGGPQLLATATDAARQVIHVEALLLYARLGDGNLTMVAASGAPESMLGRREASSSGPLKEALAGTKARLLGETESRSFIPRMQSAVIMPVAPVGERPEGVVVALSERQRGLDASDVATLTRFAPQLWLALKIARQQEWWSTAIRPEQNSGSPSDSSTRPSETTRRSRT